MVISSYHAGKIKEYYIITLFSNCFIGDGYLGSLHATAQAIQCHLERSIIDIVADVPY